LCEEKRDLHQNKSAIAYHGYAGRETFINLEKENDMIVTSAFFEWFYYGFAGHLGGWIIFLLISLAAVIWLLYDSASRRLPATGWRMAVILTALLMVPAIIYRFTSVCVPVPVLIICTNTQLASYAEVFFYLGLLGGVLPLMLAIGYYITYRGLTACPQGHIYEAVLGQCPDPSHNPPRPVYVAPAPAPVQQPQREYEPAAPPPPSKRKVQAWLTARDGHSYQLCQGETTIGRSLQNDVCIKGDATVGRQHAKIMEQNGRFILIDLGAKNFTRVNGRVVREQVLLQQDDELQLGDSTYLRFMASH
jgi:hypothetical protein